MLGFRKQGPNEGLANVGKTERKISAVIGGLLLGSLAIKGLTGKWARLGAGLLMVERAITGFCTFYKLLGITSVEQEEGRVVDLPLRHGLEIEHAVTVNRPRDEVYAYWRNLSNLPQFMRHLESVTELGAGRSHWVAKAPIAVEWDAEITTERPGELIGWRSVESAAVKNAGSVRFKDAPGGRGTEVHVYFEYQPVAGPAGHAVAKLIKQITLQQVRMDLGRFKAMLEAGEAPTTDGQTSGRAAMRKDKPTVKERLSQRKDVVQTASEESFPASDAPGWITQSTG